jgi:hypothetical protein
MDDDSLPVLDLDPATFGLPPEVRIYLDVERETAASTLSVSFFRSNIFYVIRLALHGLPLRSFAANFRVEG